MKNINKSLIGILLVAITGFALADNEQRLPCDGSPVAPIHKSSQAACNFGTPWNASPDDPPGQLYCNKSDKPVLVTFQVLPTDASGNKLSNVEIAGCGQQTQTLIAAQSETISCMIPAAAGATATVGSGLYIRSIARTQGAQAKHAMGCYTTQAVAPPATSQK